MGAAEALGEEAMGEWDEVELGGADWVRATSGRRPR